MTLRHQWRDFITDPKRPGRHLSNIGKAVAASNAPLIEESKLLEFVGKLSEGTNDVVLLAGVLDLVMGGYHDFCLRQLPALLDSLANEKAGKESIVGPALRGNTRWDLTILARLSGRLNHAQFITRLPVRSFELPENALVRWLVDELVQTVSWTEMRIGSNALPLAMAGIRGACEEALRHPWFRDISAPQLLDVHMRNAAQRQRLPAYRKAAILAAQRQRYRDRDRYARWASLLDLLSANWLAPIADDDLFELYALILTLDIFENELGLGAPHQFGLAAPGRSHVALFERGTSRVRVFFDQSPHSTFGIPSYQLQILGAHLGIRGIPRRPDVVIIHEAPEGDRFVFIEVKKTADSSYISDSVYKALGYISDFRAIWSKSPSNPKIIVIFPEDISPRADTDLSQQEIVLVSSLDRANISASLRFALGV